MPQGLWDEPGCRHALWAVVVPGVAGTGRAASRARRGRRRRGAGPGLDPPAGKRTAQTVSDAGGPAGHPRRRAVPSPVYGAVRTSRVTVEVYVAGTDRKSTRLNSSHLGISYAVF